MKHLSLKILARTVSGRRKALKYSQAKLSEKTGINRSILSRLEAQDYTPSVDQLLALSTILGFEIQDVFLEEQASAVKRLGAGTSTGAEGGSGETGAEPAGQLADGTGLSGTLTISGPLTRKKIAVAGTGYVGLSLAVLLSQHNDVTAVDILEEKVRQINNWTSPIKDDYIERYLDQHEERGLSLRATTDGASAYADADFIIVAAPTNYDPKTNFFDCSAVESVLSLIKEVTEKDGRAVPKPVVIIKSTVPVGYTAYIREKIGMDNILFSPEFLRESKALYDNLYPSRIIVGAEEMNMHAAMPAIVRTPTSTMNMNVSMLSLLKLTAASTSIITEKIALPRRIILSLLNSFSRWGLEAASFSEDTWAPSAL